MRTVTIDVTQEDIALGIRTERRDCLVARAISRAFPGVNVKVDSAFVYFDGVEVETPMRVSGLIIAFDYGASVKPFSFKLRLPESIVK